LEICENGDAIIELTPELCGEMGWKVGDTLDIDYKDGEVILKKVEKS
jgi:formylmethanofuran dehydrogenase subunit D